MREQFWARFEIFALFALLLILFVAHMGMMGLSRPPEMIHWVETLISSVFAALVAMLAGNKKGTP